METVRAIVRQADRAFDRGDYASAVMQYRLAYDELRKKLQRLTRHRWLSRGAAWCAAILTGGLGWQDIVIIPVISKLLEKAMGINVAEVEQVARHIARHELTATLHTPDLLHSGSDRRFLQRFALLYSDAGQTNWVERMVDLYVPVLEEGKAPQRELEPHVVMEMIRKQIGPMQVHNPSMNELLARFAAQRRWSSLANTLAQYGYHSDRGPDAGQRRGSPGRPDSVNDAYQLLGVAPGADPRAVRRAYRRMMAQWHPDKLSGMAPELREYAEEQVRRLNRAYHMIKKAKSG